ncbi:MAG: DnaD domain protein [Mycoplasmataceae bacterium]|jgi:replication initiation and membrane attachment protein|nr:DnaD domain protein [Mycoplasmataceae bacterium]
MLQNNRFYAVKKYAFTFNDNFLQDLYAPILGISSTNLYIKLVHEAEKQLITLGAATETSDFFKQISYTVIEFGEARIKLEALGLITSYHEVKDTNSTYTFIINEPLNFKSFNENQKFRHLLIKQIGEVNYQKLEYVYSANRIPRSANNITVTFESVFNDQEIEKISSMNFDELYRRIAACTSLPITIGKEAKAVIESYFKNYDLSINEIERAVYNAVVLTDDHMYHVDPELLRLKFHQMLNSVNNINVLQNIKLNRNTKMFVQHLDSTENSKVFADYQSLNAEQYLRAIVKSALTNEQLEIINLLRSKFLLPDFIINLLVDYTLFKTNGTLNRKYITKTAQTINNLGLKSLDAIYDHFHFINNVSYSLQSSKHEVQETLVEWMPQGIDNES